jgi:RNA polymerase sigma factor (sigma-70 family)
MARYRFWFHNKDRNGKPLDERILKAAEELAPSLTRYRHEEIESKSTANDILQDAVEAASKVTLSKRITNPEGYLTSIYKRFVDKFLERNKRVIAVGDGFLERLANTEYTTSFEDWMHNRIVLEQLMKLMDPDTRRICLWRCHGFSEREIAKKLRTTPNAVSVRFTRGYKEALEKLRRGHRNPEVT